MKNNQSEMNSVCSSIVSSVLEVYASDSEKTIEWNEISFHNSVLSINTIFSCNGLPWVKSKENLEVERVEILMAWGGPAARIVWEPNKDSYIEYQDWSTPWEAYYPEDRASFNEALERLFYFEES